MSLAFSEKWHRIGPREHGFLGELWNLPESNQYGFGIGIEHEFSISENKCCEYNVPG